MQPKTADSHASIASEVDDQYRSNPVPFDSLIDIARRPSTPIAPGTCSLYPNRRSPCLIDETGCSSISGRSFRLPTSDLNPQPHVGARRLIGVNDGRLGVMGFQDRSYRRWRQPSRRAPDLASESDIDDVPFPGKTTAGRYRGR